MNLTETKQALMDAWTWCDENDKSTEFMIQYMADAAEVSTEYVVDFLERYAKEAPYD